MDTTFLPGSQGQKKTWKSPGTKHKKCCVQAYGCWEKNLSPLKERQVQVFLTMDSDL